MAKRLPTVFIQSTHTFIKVGDKFLSMVKGHIGLYRLQEEDGVYFWEGEPLQPLDYKRKDAVRKYHTSTLSRTHAADQAIRGVLGEEEGAGRVVDAPRERKSQKKTPPQKKADGYSLASICQELGVSPSEARKELRRQKIKKPGSRWEWTDAEERDNIVNMLKEL